MASLVRFLLFVALLALVPRPVAAQDTATRSSRADASPQAIVSTPPYAPAGELLLMGLAAPGLGHFRDDRPLVGAAYLGAAGGALAWGLLSRRQEDWCAMPMTVDICPAEHIVASSSVRHRVRTGLIAAATITATGAVHAFLASRSRSAGETSSGPRVELGVARPSPDGVQIDVLAVRF